jgi:hypothetical protein
VVFIYTMSGLVRDGRSNGGGRRQVLVGSEWLGGNGGISKLMTTWESNTLLTTSDN